MESMFRVFELTYRRELKKIFTSVPIKSPMTSAKKTEKSFSLPCPFKLRMSRLQAPPADSSVLHARRHSGDVQPHAFHTLFTKLPQR